MLASVEIDESGAVRVLVDSEETDVALIGLCLDAMLEQASKTAVETWFALRTETDEAE